MKTNSAGSETILCISTREQGHTMLRALAQLGCRITLLTLEDLQDAGWPHEALEEVQTMPGGMSPEQIRNTVTYLARTRNFSRILPLSGADMETAATLREHMRISGMGLTTTRYFTDVLAMRAKATYLGVRASAYAPILNYDDLRAFMESVPAPWLLRPRGVVSEIGGQTIQNSEQVWRALEELGDRQSDFLLEQSIPGEIFSVYGVCAGGKMRCNIVRADTENCPAVNSHLERAIQATHAELISALGMVRGVVRTKFLRSEATDILYFLETVADPGGNGIVEAIEQTNGVNLWHEWARAEVAAMRA